eukprot:UN04342
MLTKERTFVQVNLTHDLIYINIWCCVCFVFRNTKKSTGCVSFFVGGQCCRAFNMRSLRGHGKDLTKITNIFGVNTLLSR